jgi:hypothetical protein
MGTSGGSANACLDVMDSENLPVADYCRRLLVARRDRLRLIGGAFYRQRLEIEAEPSETRRELEGFRFRAP